MGEAKYRVNYDGKDMSLMQYAELKGIPYYTLRNRARDGRPLDAPIRKQAKPKESLAPRRGGYADGYSFDELVEMYSRFNTEENEIQLLMDFTGLTYRETLELQKKLDKELARRKYA